jgi:hypothetical protein
MDSGQAATEMKKVVRALMFTSLLLRSLDQVNAAIQLADGVAYSPLRTAVEQAEKAAVEILSHLLTEAARG